MPFKSLKQARFMFAAENRGDIKKGTAEEWAKETDFKKLKESKRKKAIQKVMNGG